MPKKMKRNYHKIYQNVSKEVDISYDKVENICIAILKEMNYLLSSDNEINIDGFIKISPYLSLPRYVVDKRNGRRYLSKGKRSLSVHTCPKLIKKIKELVSEDAERKD